MPVISRPRDVGRTLGPASLRRVLLPLALVVAISLLPVAGVAATNALGWKAGDNNIVSFNLSALTTTIHDAWHFNNTNSIDPTDISPTHAHDSSGLVTVTDAGYGDTGWYGAYYCNVFKLQRHEMLRRPCPHQSNVRAVFQH